MLTIRELVIALAQLDPEAEVRIGDVSEGDDLHCSVGRVIIRSQKLVLVPGDDDVWKDETLSSIFHSELLWPKEEEESED